VDVAREEAATGMTKRVVSTVADEAREATAIERTRRAIEIMVVREKGYV